MTDNRPAPPSPPRKPDPDECCGSGCALCVFDRYERELERYYAELRLWQARNDPSPRP